MNRSDVLECVARLRGGVPMIISPGLQNHPIGLRADDPLTIYGMDMSYATPIALGIALGWPDRKAVALTGDGDLLAGPGVLTTIARYAPPNLIVIVFDNGAYLTTGTGRAPTATETGTDLEGLGRCAGMTHTCTVAEIGAAREAIERAFREPGPWLVVAKVDRTDRQRSEGAEPLPVDVYESGLRFRRAALEQRAATSRPKGDAG
jgi:sulfopyruvate decarboxylase subunit beta